MRYPALVSTLALALLTACGDTPVSPGSAASGDGPFHPADPIPAQPRVGIGAFGVLLETTASRIVFRQETFGFAPTADIPAASMHRLPPIGAEGARLEVAIDSATAFVVGGTPAELGDLVTGGHYLVLGKLRSGVFTAVTILDLSDSHALTPADRRRMQAGRDTTTMVSRVVTPAPRPRAHLSLCIGQGFDYDEAQVLEFQGCWGGPSVADAFDVPDIPVACNPLGCVVVTRMTYTAALGGWGYGFPFRFSATTPGLVYHVPGTIALDLEPLPATSSALTFSGGLGVGVTLDLDYCTLLGCFGLGTASISQLSSIHQSTEAAPLPGEVMTIAEAACPGIGVPIPGLEDALELGICEDLDLSGELFHANAEASVPGRPFPIASDSIHFDGQPQEFQVRPTALSVELTESGFNYIPTLTVGLKLQLEVLFVTVWESPTLPITDGPFAAITTPFPTGPFTLATDPDLSGDLPQPTDVAFTFEVAPAPTRLSIISSDFLTEDEPVAARLQEDYDGSPIAGVAVRFTASGEDGTVVLTGTTASNGVARVRLPAGEYALTAAFAGNEYYLPSEDHREQVFVYRPTTFVIWGGGLGGVQVGQDYLFWGSQWWKQVSGDDKGIASFKGFAIPTGSTTWRNPPAMAARPPATIARYISVIVTTRFSGTGASLTGNIAGHAILRVDTPEGYRPNPGHDASGVVRAILPDTPTSVAGGLGTWPFGR